MMNKMYIFAGSHKIAEGNGMIEPDGRLSAAPAPEAWGRADADPMQDVVDAVDRLNLRQKMVMGSLTFDVKKVSKKVRRLMHRFNRPPRLPRKLKKAARHAEFKVKKKPAGIKITIEVTQEQMDVLADKMIKEHKEE